MRKIKRNRYIWQDSSPEKINALLARLVTILWLGWFVVGSLHVALYQLPQSDDALRVQVAKNWAHGDGWASSYSGRIPFPLDISIGPTIIVPEAVFNLLAGNAFWIPGITALLLNLFALYLCCRYLARLLPLPMTGCAALLAACSWFMPQDFTSTTGYYTFGLLLLLAALMATSKPVPTARNELLVGLVLALAFLTKTFSLLGQLCLMFFLFTYSIAAHGVMAALRRIFWQCSGFMLLLLPWLYYQNVVMQTYSEEFRTAWNDYNNDFFRYHGSGSGQLADADEKIGYLQKNMIRNVNLFGTAMREIGISTSIFVLGVLFAFGVSLKHFQYLRQASLAILSVLVMAAGYGMWYILLSFSMTPGHSVSATLLGIIAFLLALASVVPPRLQAVFPLLLILLLACFQRENVGLVYAMKTDDRSKEADLHKAAAFIQNHAFRYPLVGCGFFGYPRHLEYLLPGSLHFRDCFDLLSDSVVLDNQGYLSANTLLPGMNTPLEDFYQKAGKQPVQYSFSWKTVPGFTLVLALPSIIMDPYLGKIVHACGNRVLYRSEQVHVVECMPEQIQQRIKPDEIMYDIAVMQRWYKTRLNPYEGKSFATYPEE